MELSVINPILDHKGKEIVENGENILLGDVIASYLLLSSTEESPLEKAKSYRLATKIGAAVESAKPVVLNQKEIDLIQKKAGEFASVVVYGFVMSMLDPEWADKE